MTAGVDLASGLAGPHPSSKAPGTGIDGRSPARGTAAIRRLIHHPSGLAGGVIVIAVLFLAFAAPLISPHDPNAQDATAPLQPPSWRYLLGTDDLGRDVLSRVIYGASNVVYIGVIAVGIGAAVGVTAGVLTAYFGGWRDFLTSRVFDVLLAFPGIILAIVVIAILGSGTRQVVYAVALVNAPEFFRISRASVLEQKGREYVAATECLGAGDMRIMLRHLLPNSLGPLFVQVTVAMGFAIRLAAGLSFIGLGTQPPTAAWGNMLQEAFGLLPLGWWLAVFPGVALAIFLVGLNLLSDGLRDVFDPRSAYGQ